MIWPTLSDYILDDTTIWAYCGRQIPCGHEARLDLSATIAAHGDVRLPELRRRLKCACGHRGARLSLVPSRLIRDTQEIARRKNIIADAIARGMAAVNDARAEIRAGKPMRL